MRKAPVPGSVARCREGYLGTVADGSAAVQPAQAAGEVLVAFPLPVSVWGAGRWQESHLCWFLPGELQLIDRSRAKYELSVAFAAFQQHATEVEFEKLVKAMMAWQFVKNGPGVGLPPTTPPG